MIDAAWDMSNRSGAVNLVKGRLGAAIILPPARNVAWSPGMMSKGGASGAGIPVRSTVFTTVSPSGLQDGTDVTAINAAITSCPSGQVVRLAAGQFFIGLADPNYILLNKDITLRGAGAGQTIITKVDGCRLETPFTASQAGTVLTVTAMLGGRDLVVGDTISAAANDKILSFGTGTGREGSYNMSVSATVGSGLMQAGNFFGAAAAPIIVVGTSKDLMRFGDRDLTNNSTNLTADVRLGDRSITVASTANFSSGQFVLLDQTSSAQWFPCTLPGNDIAAVLTASISGTVMTVTAIGAGSFGTGVLRQYMTLAGQGIPAGLFVVAQTSGVAGSTGMYTVSASLIISSETINAGYLMWAELGARFMWRKQRPFTAGQENLGYGVVTGSITGSVLTVTSQDAGSTDVGFTVAMTGQVPSPNDVTIVSGAAPTWNLASAPGNSSGQYEVHQWPSKPNSAGDFFHRLNRPWTEIKEIATIAGNTVTFTSPVIFDYKTRQIAQMTFSDASNDIPTPFLQGAGVENLTVEQGDADNISFKFAAYCWAKNVEARIYNGHNVSFDSSFRCELRESYVHDACFPQPGGGAYNISFEGGASEILVENCISVLANKIIVSHASGAGCVVAYNYMDQQYIDYTGDAGGNCWIETGINSSHIAGSHHVLFEGNWGSNGDSDNNHGCSGHAIHFRGNYAIFRKPFLNLKNGVTYDDMTMPSGPMRAAATQSYNLTMTYVGNVLGTQGKMSGHGFVYDDPNGISPSVWLIGWDNNETPSPASEPLARASMIRDGNWDWLQGVQSWHNTPATFTMPESLYLPGKPAFFGGRQWPWVNPATGAIAVLPAKERYDAGNPNGA